MVDDGWLIGWLMMGEVVDGLKVDDLVGWFFDG